MPATDSPAVIVARFLRANQYLETLDAFTQEAGLPPDSGSIGVGDWTIEKILEEKKQYDSSLTYERSSERDSNKGWKLPAPSTAHTPENHPSVSNILSVHGTACRDFSHLYVSYADRTLHQLSSSTPYDRYADSTFDSPVLSIATVRAHDDHDHSPLILSTSMSGKLIASSIHDGNFNIHCTQADHTKYAVQVTSSDEIASQDRRWWVVATAGWDKRICLYILESPFDPHTNAATPALIGEPTARISLASNPESMIFARHPDTNDLHLIFSRRDSTQLLYYRISEIDIIMHSTLKIQKAGTQNLAPHSNAWIGFTPSSLALCPTDPTLLAVATSHLPHMKLIIVRLLFPPQQTSDPATAPRTQSTQARAALTVQDREDTAIALHVSTMAPQTPYSTPQVVWRPDGSGVWVNGDDGVVRGIDAQSGKVVATLIAHEAGSKVRSLWAGMLWGAEKDEQGRPTVQEEVLVSGGFDKKVFIWRIAGH